MLLFQAGKKSHEAPPTTPVEEAAQSKPPEESDVPAENPLQVDGKPSIEVVQDLFAGLRDWAFWTDDRTEFAVWNSTTLSFSDHFEVIRLRDADYFRAIPGFSRLPLDGYGPPNSPILFTETAEQRAKRYYQANPDKVPPPPPRPVPVELNSVPRPPEGD